MPSSKRHSLFNASIYSDDINYQEKYQIPHIGAICRKPSLISHFLENLRLSSIVAKFIASFAIRGFPDAGLSLRPRQTNRCTATVGAMPRDWRSKTLMTFTSTPSNEVARVHPPFKEKQRDGYSKFGRPWRIAYSALARSQ